mmetsp:Transcript_169/g.310  ORF Transcript_169/g.310 Transcript_169/m.310 type:complete len:94 (-) Transcript_169:185-466(-)
MSSRFANWVETTNELTTLLILYMLMLFTDFVGEPEERGDLGIAYISIIIAFAIAHGIILLVSTIMLLIKKIRGCCYRRKMKKIQQLRAQQQQQ